MDRDGATDAGVEVEVVGQDARAGGGGVRDDAPPPTSTSPASSPAASSSDGDSSDSGSDDGSDSGSSKSDSSGSEGEEVGADGEDEEEDEEDEEDEEEAAAVRTGFIADTDTSSTESSDESSESESESEAESGDDAVAGRKRRRRLRREGVRGDEDDLELVAEAGGLEPRSRRDGGGDRFQGPAPKRMRPAVGDGGGTDGGAGDGGALEGGEEGDGGAPGGVVVADDDEYDSEGLDEFIDDEGLGVGGEGGGVPQRSKPAREGGTAGMLNPRVDTAMMADFEDVFGPSGGLGVRLGEEEEEVMGMGGPSLADLFEAEEEAEEAETGAVRRRVGAAAAVGPGGKRDKPGFMAGLEPAILAANLMTPDDILIRDRDVPERVQLMLRQREGRRQRLRQAATRGLHGGDAATAPSFLSTFATTPELSMQAEAAWIADRLLADTAVAMLSPKVELPATVPSLRTLMVAAAGGGTRAISSEDLRPTITTILTHTYDRCTDVPTLWTYWRDELLPGFTLAAVWAVLDLDEVWTRLVATKCDVADIVTRAQERGIVPDDALPLLLEALVRAESDRSVADVMEYVRVMLVAGAGTRGITLDIAALAASARQAASLSLPSVAAAPAAAADLSAAVDDIFGEMEVADGGGGVAGGAAVTGMNGGNAAEGGAGARQGGTVLTAAVAGVASRTDLYAAAVSSGVARVVRAVFLPAHHLAANLRAGTFVHPPPDTLESGTPGGDGGVAAALSMLATECTSPEFVDAAAVMAGAQLVASRELATEPYLRALIRGRYLDNMVFTVTATERGERDIDVTHPFYGVQYLTKTFGSMPNAYSSYTYAQAKRSSGLSAAAAAELLAAGASLVDDDHPPASLELTPHPLTNSVSFLQGWASHCGSERLVTVEGGMTGEGSIVRQQARVGGPTQFTLIDKAARDGLVTLSFLVDDSIVKALFKELATLYLSPAGVAALAMSDALPLHKPDTHVPGLSALDAMRRGALAAVVTGAALDDAKTYARATLTRLANESIAGEFASALRRRLAVAPPQPPPHPLRKRKGEADGTGTGGVGPGGLDRTAPMSRVLGQVVRCRTMAVGVGRAGLDPSAGGHGADVAVMLDPRGEFVESVTLPTDRGAREEVMARFMFRHAPDVVAVSLGSGYKCRDMHASILNAALRFEALVQQARKNHRTRRELDRIRVEAMANNANQFAEAWKAAELDAGLQPYAERWTVGRWKLLRPRAPASREEEGTTRDGRRVVVRVPMEEGSTLPVVYVEDEFARVYATSVRGREEFPDATITTRYAISIGRWCQDPLAEAAYLWASRADVHAAGVTAAALAGVAAVPAELAAVRLHPLQGEVPPYLLYIAAERAMVEAVNAVGVDALLVAGRPHLQPVLQFVAGLGPRKANAMLDALRGAGDSVRTRAQLAARRIMSPRVYDNAVGFIRMRPVTACFAAVYADGGRRAEAGRGDGDDDGEEEEEEEEEEAEGFHPLDSTRIHPNEYRYALLMAREVVIAREVMGPLWDDKAPDPTAGGKYNSDLRAVMAHTRKVLAAHLQRLSLRLDEWDPMDCDRAQPVTQLGPNGMPQTVMVSLDPHDSLHDFDLVAWSSLEAKEAGRGMYALMMAMRAELRLPFRDPRRPWRVPTPAALFRLLSGETASTFHPGIVASGRVVRVAGAGMRVRLDNGIMGWISFRNIAHLPPDADPATLFQRDAVVTGKVFSIDRVKFTCDMELLPPLGPGADAAMIERHDSAPPVCDVYFDSRRAREKAHEVVAATLAAAARASLATGGSVGMAAAAARGIGLTVRAINHPRFRNAVKEEAVASLASEPLYACLFRPSSQGTHALTATWKLFEPAYCAHIHIAEGDKEGMPANALGRRLTIDNVYSYADLDEVLVRHVGPMSAHHARLRSSGVYQEASQQRVDEYIRNQLAENPARVPYVLSPHVDHIGVYILSYAFKPSHIHHEAVTITPGGFKWRGKVSPTWQKMVEDFKARCRQRPPAPGGTAAPAAPAVPAPAPAVPVAASGAGGYGRWDMAAPAPPMQGGYGYGYGGAGAYGGAGGYGGVGAPGYGDGSAGGWNAWPANAGGYGMGMNAYGGASGGGGGTGY